jgi:hypothetical protein
MLFLILIHLVVFGILGAAGESKISHSILRPALHSSAGALDTAWQFPGLFHFVSPYRIEGPIEHIGNPQEYFNQYSKIHYANHTNDTFLSLHSCTWCDTDASRCIENGKLYFIKSTSGNIIDGHADMSRERERERER